MILAGDVGGTKTILALFDVGARGRSPIRESRFASQEHRSFESIVERFFSEAGVRPSRLRAAAVGVAGPVVADRSQIVNLPWPVDARRLERKLGLSRVSVLNDLEATAWGVARLGRGKIHDLTPELRPRAGNRALIAAGTGLGMALSVWDGERYHHGPSEGGHQSFAPRDEVEIDLLLELRERFGRVSWERVVSGPGLSALYRFFVQRGRSLGADATSEAILQAEDANAAVAQAGLEGSDPSAVASLQRFVSLYGAVAGDLALATKAVGGVYVGGGIAPRILPALRSGEFVRAFRDKGRLTSLVERIPIRVILEPRTALLGAAERAEFSISPRAGGGARRGSKQRTDR